MNIILFLVFGAVVGWLTSLIVKTNSTQGTLGDIVLGILGALVGGLIMDFFGQPGITGFNLYSMIVGILGAVIFVLVGKSLRRTLS